MSRRRRSREERSAGGVVLRHIEGEPHVLIIRDPYKNWGLPKGHLEDGEDPESAALREVREETGLEDLELGQGLGTIDWYFRLRDVVIHKYCDFFLMISTSGDPVPETEEGITEAVWVPLEDAPGRITYDNARSIVVKAIERLSGPVEEDA